MDKGKDKEKRVVYVGCKAYTPGILHELQDDNLSDTFVECNGQRPG